MAKTISDVDRARMLREILGESAKTISDADRARGQVASEELYMKRNDGGIAKNTRVF